MAPEPFDPAKLPPPTDTAAADRNAQQLSTLQGQLAAKDQAYVESLEKIAATEEEVARLKAELQQVKAANAKTIADAAYNFLISLTFSPRG